MSIKVQNFGNVENVTVIEFGHGTLSVVNGTNDGYKSLLIREKEFSPIGEKGEFKADSDEFEPQIAIIFHNQESFEIFKEYVNNIDIEFKKKNINLNNKHNEKHI